VKRLDYLPQADADLDGIYAWLAQDDAAAAARIVKRIVARAQRLADYPESGRARPEIGDGVRSLIAGKYLILYRIGPDSVDIVRVIHGAHDLAGLLISGITPENRHEEPDCGPPVGREFR
jgi:toxin ParE1/3/4